jgi:hypothetical protein
MTAKFAVLCAIVTAFGGALSCASGPQKEANASDDAARESEAQKPAERHATTAATDSDSDSDSTAVANTCEDRPCYSNSDCCKGRFCAFDPDRSHVQRYCLQ